MTTRNFDHGEKAFRATPSRLFLRHQYVKCLLLGPAVSVSFDRQFRCRVTNGHAPYIIANTMASPGPAISTRWLYDLIDRAHGHGDTELSALLRRKYKKNHP